MMLAGGSKLGPYEIHSPLGAGVMGNIFGLGTTVGIPFAAQVGLKLAF